MSVISMLSRRNGSVKGFVQRLLVDLRHVVALEAVQVHLDRACVGVLGHELPAQSVQLLLDVLRELQGVDAGPIQRHRLRPHLFNIDAGSRFVFQDMNFRLSFVHQHRQEAPVGGTVEGYLYPTSAWGFAHWENMERKEVLVELEEGENEIRLFNDEGPMSHIRGIAPTLDGR